MDILDRIRNTRPEDLVGVPSTFDDLPVPTIRRRAPKDMIRTVEGADDLKVNRPAPKNPGMVKTQSWESFEKVMDRKDPRSDRQVELMESLVGQLNDLDPEIGTQARTYTDGMTSHGKWTGGRDGNASRWIGNMISKVRELKDASQRTTIKTTDSYADVPDGYYAVQDSGPGDWKFYRVSTGRAGTTYAGRRFLKVQASDELHPVRNGNVYRAVFNTIRAMGPAASMAAYGQHIGRCGRCHITLTDAESRAFGIGPHCRSKM
jgi:hypothetical protein